MENSEKWGVDMFRISELTDKKTLTCVTYTIFQERDLIKTFKIPGKVFLNFLRTLEDHYLQVYHQTLLVLQTLCELSRSILRLISATLINHQIIFAWINIHHWLDSECWCSTKRRLLLLVFFFQFSFWSFHFFAFIALYSIPHTNRRNPNHPIHTQSNGSFTVLHPTQTVFFTSNFVAKIFPIVFEVSATIFDMQSSDKGKTRSVGDPSQKLWPIMDFWQICSLSFPCISESVADTSETIQIWQNQMFSQIIDLEEHKTSETCGSSMVL